MELEPPVSVPIWEHLWEPVRDLLGSLQGALASLLGAPGVHPERVWERLQASDASWESRRLRTQPER